MGSDYHLQQSINAVNMQRSLLVVNDAARLVAGNGLTREQAIRAALAHEAAEREASNDVRGVHQVAVPPLEFQGDPSERQVNVIAQLLLPEVQEQMGIELDD